MIEVTTTIYEISKAEIKKMIAKELGVDPSKMDIQFTIGYEGDSDRLGYSSYPVCKQVTVTVRK